MTTITDVACTVCGCVCDDLAITVDNGRVVRAEGACALAEPWFLAQNAHTPPAAEIDGRAVALEAAYARAAGRAARPPGTRSSTACRAARRRASAPPRPSPTASAATIDTTASTGHAPSIMALQQVGESTATLGEFKNRADLVVFWGTDPVLTHPRHLERYSVDAVGRWAPGGRADRFVVVIDEHETETAKRADLFIPVAPGRHWEALWSLRLLVRGLESPGMAMPGLWADLAARMKSCRCGVVFFGAGVTRERLAHRTVERCCSS